jgi:tetratricopeptide (TPR) repeat protein
VAIKKKTIVKEKSLLNWKVLILVTLTFLAFIPSFNSEFVNWDDIVYIMNNDLITTFSWINLKEIFSTFFMGNYHPFTLLSFSLDYHLFKMAAPGYHMHNILLHVLNSFLVYVFFFNLLKKNVNVAVTIAVLFAVHPMHVESVAWVSERKDLLYTAYYLLSLIAYLAYLRNSKNSFLLLALLFFIFSLLSKAQAVTLPLVLLLIDYFVARKFDWKNVFEKIPFLALSLIFGIIAVFAQKASNFINPSGINLLESLFYAPYGLVIYMVKFLAPVYQTAVYLYPVTVQGAIPFYVYFSPLIFIAFLFAIWKTWKNHRYITFGLLFFLATIFPVLQFLPVGPALVAERYTYVPYLGLAAILSIFFWEKRMAIVLRKRKILDATAILFILLLTVLTVNRNQVWKNSIALWTDVLDKDPGCFMAYSNRAFMLNENKQYEEALRDLSSCLKIDSTDYNTYKSKAIIYNYTGNYKLALENYSQAIRYNPEDHKCYFLRGTLYISKLKLNEPGIVDLKKHLTYAPDDLDANFNLGVGYYNSGNKDSARVYFRKVLKLDPGEKQALQLLNSIGQ